MKNQNQSFEDVSPSVGVYEGDLKYGRCLETTPKRRKDFSAERQENGSSKNLPIAPLILQEQRDPRLWKKDPKVKQFSKRLVNPPQLVDEVMQGMLRYPHGLASHLFAVKLGNRRLNKRAGA